MKGAGMKFPKRRTRGKQLGRSRHLCCLTEIPISAPSRNRPSIRSLLEQKDESRHNEDSNVQQK